MSGPEHYPLAVPAVDKGGRLESFTAACSCGWVGPTFHVDCYGVAGARSVARLSAQRHEESQEVTGRA